MPATNPLPPLPSALAGCVGADPRVDAWVGSLPAQARGTLQKWGLRVETDKGGTPAALPGAERAQYSWVLPVRDADDAPLVLKLALPDEDRAGEAPALKAWNAAGSPAVTLARATPRTGSLLLERAGPRTLDELPVLEACEVAGGLLARLAVPAPPTLPRLAPRVAGWLDDLELLGRAVPAPPRFAAQALALGRRLVGGADAEDVADRVVHGDLHGENVLAAPPGDPRGAWLALDPKGFAGDPAYDVAPLLWNRWDEATRHGNAAGAVLARFYAVVDAAGLAEERARDWVIVRAMVAASWEVLGAHAALDSAARERVTRYVTVAKAMQEVRAVSW